MAICFLCGAAMAPRFRARDHLRLFTERSRRKALAAAGLRVFRVPYTGETHQFSRLWLADQTMVQADIAQDR